MTELGKPLVFYLKYMDAMNHLCYPEFHRGEPDLTGLDDAEQVRERAHIVRAAACEQVADFLGLCARSIEHHFTGLGNITLAKKRTRAFVKDNWEWETRVYVSSVPGGWFSCGALVTAPLDVRISLGKNVCGVVVPWLWSRGGQRGGDALWKVVGSWADSRAGEGLVDDRGAIALARIPIKPQPADSFDVDRDPPIAEVAKTFARIGAKETKAIANFMAGLKEPEET